MKERIERIGEKLYKSNFKLTNQRKTVLEVLIENDAEHLSADDIYLLVKGKAPEIGLATVYRTLELLCELNVIEKIYFGDSITRFELRSEEELHSHHHLVCVKCGKVQEINEDWLGIIEEKVEKEYNFEIKDHRLIFEGLCNECKNKGES